MRFQRPQSAAILDGHEAARLFFSASFHPGSDPRERVWVAHVDAGARCLHVKCYDGEPDSVELPVRDIIVDAAKLGSAGILLAHNHPGGDPSPSKADCAAMRRLVRAGEAVDLAILDHLIFAGERCSSMRRLGLI